MTIHLQRRALGRIRWCPTRWCLCPHSDVTSHIMRSWRRPRAALPISVRAKGANAASVLCGGASPLLRWHRLRAAVVRAKRTHQSTGATRYTASSDYSSLPGWQLGVRGRL